MTQRWVGSIGLAAAVGLAYFVAADFSVRLILKPEGVAVFWPAAGISSGILIALGPRARWPVLAGVIVALVGRAGDAVIAGTAAPGAAVELLHNGEPLDRAIADQFGQFVMNPSRLPSGDYELTLRSRQVNGKQATSRRSVAVTVQPSQQNMALTTSEKESVIPTKPVVVPSIVRHPSRARREAKGPAAQDVSGLRPKLFNHVVGSHQ